jgi:ElaB/YqjD/DUF883 family membrane-anchored ribosome-binding protein
MAKTTKRGNHAAYNGAEALNELPLEALDAVKELVKEVRDETLELVRSSREQVDELSGVAGRTIRGNPFRSVCIAMGIGCMIGIVLGRR